MNDDDEFSPLLMYDLIDDDEHFEWDPIVNRIESHPQEVLNYCPSGKKCGDECILHYFLLRSDVPMRVVNQIIMSIPEAVSYISSERASVIHCVLHSAVYSDNPSRFRHFEELIMMFLNYCPDLAHVWCPRVGYPIMVCLSSDEVLINFRSEGRRKFWLLSDECVRISRRLAELNPSGFAARTHKGPYFRYISIIDSLKDIWSLETLDDLSKSNLLKLTEIAVTTRAKEQDRSHQGASSSIMYNIVRDIEWKLSSSPTLWEEMVRKYGNQKNFENDEYDVLHEAIRQRYDWMPIVKVIYESNPLAAEYLTKCERIHPFMLAASKGRINTAFELLRKSPDVLQFYFHTRLTSNKRIY